MKIIRPSSPHKKKLHGKCNECGTVVECDKEEACLRLLPSYIFSKGLFVRCPECANENLEVW